MLKDYDRVRVVRLLMPERPYIEGSTGVSRSPRTGGEGTIVETWLPGGPFCVECTAGDYTLWLADFAG